jgi:hypothetical protein
MVSPLSQLFSLMQPHMSILGLVSWNIGVLFRKSLLIAILSGVFSVFLYCVKFSVPNLQSILNWFLLRVREWGLVSIFTCGCPVFPECLLKKQSFLQHIFLHLYLKNQVDVVSAHSLLFHWFTYCFSVGNMSFLLWWLCSTMWTQILWQIQHCFFILDCCGLGGIFCAFIWLLGFIFYFSDQWIWDFYGGQSEHEDSFQYYSHFLYYWLWHPWK